MNEQITILATHPGSIKARKPTMSELLELKFLCRDAKQSLEYVFASMQTMNLGENYDQADEAFNETGMVLDAISAFCQRNLKRIDD